MGSDAWLDIFAQYVRITRKFGICSSPTICSSKYTLSNIPASKHIRSLRYQRDVITHPLSNFRSTLRWRHNGRDGVSNHQPHHCLLNRLFGCRSKKTSKFRVTGLCAGNSPGTVKLPHKWPVTRKMFPFDDVIMSLDKLGLFWGIDDSIFHVDYLFLIKFTAGFPEHC